MRLLVNYIKLQHEDLQFTQSYLIANWGLKHVRDWAHFLTVFQKE
jgi:hypothetical protein